MKDSELVSTKRDEARRYGDGDGDGDGDGRRRRYRLKLVERPEESRLMDRLAEQETTKIGERKETAVERRKPPEKTIQQQPVQRS